MTYLSFLGRYLWINLLPMFSFCAFIPTHLFYLYFSAFVSLFIYWLSRYTYLFAFNISSLFLNSIYFWEYRYLIGFFNTGFNFQWYLCVVGYLIYNLVTLNSFFNKISIIKIFQYISIGRSSLILSCVRYVDTTWSNYCLVLIFSLT